MHDHNSYTVPPKISVPETLWKLSLLLFDSRTPVCNKTSTKPMENGIASILTLSKYLERVVIRGQERICLCVLFVCKTGTHGGTAGQLALHLLCRAMGFFLQGIQETTNTSIRRAQFDLHFKSALVCLRSYSLRFPTSPNHCTEKTKLSQTNPYFVHHQKHLERSRGSYSFWVLFPSLTWCFRKL